MNISKGKKWLSVEEVAVAVGVSVKTINNWYAFKSMKPDNELAKLLPKPKQDSVRGARRWKIEDVWKLVEFRSAIIPGRNGIMGCVTQKYIKKEKKECKN